MFVIVQFMRIRITHILTVTFQDINSTLEAANITTQLEVPFQNAPNLTTIVVS